VPVEPKDVAKTVIITPFGMFEFLFMPFGFKNAAQTFQRLMDHLLQGLPFVFIFLDDILVASPSLVEHEAHLHQVLGVLRDNGLVVNPEKCQFARETIEFLGHVVMKDGLSPLESHVGALVNFPPPSNVKQLQQFLGLLNFYRRFLPNIALMLQPLTDTLRADAGKWEWTAAMGAAFEAAKHTIQRTAQLVHPDPSAPISLATDASSTHMGAVLQQLVKGQ
jgi:Reverse transcriptase (RNA-dependent DNA polymerase)/RNase H-like domain found in reverse transcriptase